MQIGIFPSVYDVAEAGASIIMRTFEVRPDATLGVATGSTPLPMYKILREAYRQGRFSLAQAHAFALDEYVGIASDHPQRYRNVLREELVGDDKTGLLDDNLHTPDGQALDLDDAAIAYDDAIAEKGVDVQILGIGSDGHIGFNEPSGSFASRTHIGQLTAQTRKDNARFFDSLDDVPRLCLTQGLATIMDASTIVLLATGAGKAEAVRQLVEGAVSVRWPATILQHHPDVYVLVDEQAASKLELADYYREVWDGAQS